jgi:two-component system cell cycle response regulator
MTSPRPFSLPRTPEAALEELQRCAGTQFDPAVVDAFTVAWRDRTLAAAA